MQTNVKSKWKSKTVWINALTTAVAIFDYVSPIVPPAYQPALLALVGVINVGLRFVTTQPIK